MDLRHERVSVGQKIYKSSCKFYPFQSNIETMMHRSIYSFEEKKKVAKHFFFFFFFFKILALVYDGREGFFKTLKEN